MNSFLRRSANSSAGQRPSQPVTLYLIRLLPTCRIVWLYLVQHKIPYKLVDINPLDDEGTAGHQSESDTDDHNEGSELKRPSIPQDCPHRQVPVLVDGSVTVFEAPSILRYLASRYTNYAGYGDTLAKRMMTESLLSWINSELYRLVAHHVTYPQIFKECMLPSASANEVMIEHGMKLITRELESLQKRYLNGHKYLGGRDEMTIADSFATTVILQLQWIDFGFDLWPKLNQWMGDVKTQDFWEDVHTAHEIFVDGVKD